MLAQNIRYLPALKLGTCFKYLQANFPAGFQPLTVGLDAVRSFTESTFDAPPGGSCSVSSDESTDISVLNGNLDSLKVNLPSNFAAQQQHLAKGHNESAPSNDKGPVSVLIQQQSPHSGKDNALTAWVPERWCSLDVSSRGGSIAVANIVEANLRVRSAGGNIKLGKVRGSDVFIDSTGSSREPVPQPSGATSDQPSAPPPPPVPEVAAKEVSASKVIISAGSGEVAVGRLLGLDVQLACRGKAGLGAVYSDRFKAVAGSVAIANLSCSQGAAIEATAGNIKVSGLDGNAELSTADGNVRVHLNEGCGDVSIVCRNGDVHCSISPSLALEVVVHSPQGSVALDNAQLSDMSTTPTADGSSATLRGCIAPVQAPCSRLHTPDPNQQEGPPAAAAAGSAPAAGPESRLSSQARKLGRQSKSSISITHTGSGKVVLKVLDWMAALREKLARENLGKLKLAAKK